MFGMGALAALEGQRNVALPVLVAVLMYSYVEGLQSCTHAKTSFARVS